MKPRTIAIDGSAASGKSTLGSNLAQRLNYLYLDTGVMYRAVTWAVINAQIDVLNEEAVSQLAETVTLKINTPHVNDGRQATIMIDNEDVTWLIRLPEVDAQVSQISSYPGVRQVLTAQQRDIARKGPVVMVGRDIGTVVLPQADLKIFVIASAEVRAKRRYKECLERGEQVDYKQILASMKRRDKLDRAKSISPMVPAEDAIILDTDNLTKDELLQKVENLIYAKAAA